MQSAPITVLGAVAPLCNVNIRFMIDGLQSVGGEIKQTVATKLLLDVSAGKIILMAQPSAKIVR